MIVKKRFSHFVVPVGLAILALMLALATSPAHAADEQWPAPVAALANQGLTIEKKFEAPGGLTGYAASFRGKPVAVYLTADGKHAIVGTLLDAQGHDLSAEPLARIVTNPQAEKAWAQLENSHWVRDGSKDATVIVYEFTDPNCPFCHKFWEAAKPWVAAGKVQIRHIMVGILKPSSAPKSATIFADADPAAAFVRSEENYASGGIKPRDDIPSAARDKVSANNDLMQTLGYFATPTILYKTASGKVQVKQGLPQAGELEQMFGPRP